MVEAFLGYSHRGTCSFLWRKSNCHNGVCIHADKFSFTKLLDKNVDCTGAVCSLIALRGSWRVAVFFQLPKATSSLYLWPHQKEVAPSKLSQASTTTNLHRCISANISLSNSCILEINSTFTSWIHCLKSNSAKTSLSFASRSHCVCSFHSTFYGSPSSLSSSDPVWAFLFFHVIYIPSIVESCHL